MPADSMYMPNAASAQMHKPKLTHIPLANVNLELPAPAASHSP